MLKKMIKFIKNPKLALIYIMNFKIFRIIPDKYYLKIKFRLIMNKKLNLVNPKSFNEKLQWLKLYDRKPEYRIYVDKYAVRSYIAKTIGDEYLIPLLGLYNSVEEINWDSLPNKFVLKCTHGSGSNIICFDKNKLDIEEAKKKLIKWMNKNWFWFGREWPYKNVKPRIVCEEFISDKNTTPDDYKVLCFNGNAKLIEVHIDRYGSHRQDFYDMQWNKTKISQGSTTSNFVNEKPQQFEEMIQLSEKLAANMVHVRIDWFVVYDKLYFGEITFFDGAGFETFDNIEDDYLLGSWINLPI